jgi:hypothetical protein
VLPDEVVQKCLDGLAELGGVYGALAVARKSYKNTT